MKTADAFTAEGRKQKMKTAFKMLGLGEERFSGIEMGERE